jgi:hypothetical protein
VKEFQTNLAQLDKDTKALLEAAQEHKNAAANKRRSRTKRREDGGG